MQRSSETIGAIAAALAKAQAELKSREGAHCDHPRGQPARQGPDLSLCGAFEWPRHRAQGAGRP